MTGTGTGPSVPSWLLGIAGVCCCSQLEIAQRFPQPEASGPPVGLGGDRSALGLEPEARAERGPGKPECPHPAGLLPGLLPQVSMTRSKAAGFSTRATLGHSLPCGRAPAGAFFLPARSGSPPHAHPAAPSAGFVNMPRPQAQGSVAGSVGGEPDGTPLGAANWCLEIPGTAAPALPPDGGRGKSLINLGPAWAAFQTGEPG